jgi:hypothetical protein
MGANKLVRPAQGKVFNEKKPNWDQKMFQLIRDVHTVLSGPAAFTALNLLPVRNKHSCDRVSI